MTRERTNRWQIESTHFHGPNVVSYEIINGYTWTPLVNAYLSPLTLDHLPDLKEDLQRFKGLDTIVLGVFNVDLDNAWSSWSQLLADLLAEFGLIDLVQHF